MSQDDAAKIAIIPKGTVVYFNGEPCRLVEDTRVVNAYMAEVGFKEYERLTIPQDWYHRNTPTREVEDLAVVET